MVVKQSVIFAVTAVVFKALIGFCVAHFVHNVPAKGQRKWRGMLLIPWVIPPAMSTLAWFWLLRRYLAARLGVLSFMTPMFGVVAGVAFLGEPLTAHFAAGALLVAAGIVLVNLRR